MKTTKKLLDNIQTEQDARKFFEDIRWPNGIVCPKCGVQDNPYRIKRKSEKREILRCKHCKRDFSVTTGTVFEDSHIPLITWFRAFVLISSSKKGISSHQLSRMLGITQKSAWFMAHRIRFAFKDKPINKLEGIVEADETYIGGKARGKRGRGAKNKKVVFALVERNGDVRPFVGKNVKSRTLKKIIRENVDKKSIIMTDEYKVYRGLDKEFAGHETVQHGVREYVRGSVYTNTAEAFFSVMKRGIKGVYQHVSNQHLHRYTDEFGYRWNTRKQTNTERMIASIEKVEGKRLMYRDS